jgi:hypothetical protein
VSNPPATADDGVGLPQPSALSHDDRSDVGLIIKDNEGHFGRRCAWTF